MDTLTYNLLKRYRNLLLLAFFIFSMFSCVPIKDQVYLQDENHSYKKQRPKEYSMVSTPNRLIKSGDDLYISVSSADEVETMFNQQGGGVSNQPYLITYNVSAEGDVKLPYIGNVDVEGKTLEDAEKQLEAKLAEYLYLPSVKIKVINKMIYILGEVNNPGVYYFDGSEINVMQALGHAGDITTYGNRKKVMMIRNDTDKTSKLYFDLTSDASLTDENFYLVSGDLIFVEPLAKKKWRVNDNMVGIMISVINTAILIFTLVSATSN